MGAFISLTTYGECVECSPPDDDVEESSFAFEGVSILWTRMSYMLSFLIDLRSADADADADAADDERREEDVSG
jgi:hypothetical protein